MGYSAKIKIDRGRPKKDGTAAIFLQVIINRKKARLDLDIAWPPSRFHDADYCRQRFRKDPDYEEYNVIINTAKGKADSIHKEYLIRQLPLSLDVFLKEYRSGLSKHDFITYFEQKSFERWNKNQISDLTRAKEKVTVGKLKVFADEIPFNVLNINWAYELDSFLKKKFGNNVNTRWNVHKHVKTYLNMARDVDHVVFINPYLKFKNKLQEGKWGPLSLDQMKSLIELYLNIKVKDGLAVRLKDNERIVLRRFLFSCNCALRISDLQALERSQFSNGEMSITPKKTERYGTRIASVPLNDIARQMLDDELTDNPSERVFNRYSDQVSNRLLKRCAEKAELEINLHHHVARYTFASLYDQAGGNHTSLMKYMGLKKRETLEKYVKTNKGVMQGDIDKMNEMISR